VHASSERRESCARGSTGPLLAAQVSMRLTRIAPALQKIVESSDAAARTLADRIRERLAGKHSA